MKRILGKFAMSDERLQIKYKVDIQTINMVH